MIVLKSTESEDYQLILVEFLLCMMILHQSMYFWEVKERRQGPLMPIIGKLE